MPVSTIKPKVLLVEDSPDDRFKVRWMLKRSRPVSLLEASTLSQAIELWQAHSPDLVLLDLRLDGDNGAELLSQVKHQAGIGATVAVLSGLQLVPRADELHRLGVERFVAKDELTQSLLDGFIDECYADLERDEHIKKQEFVMRAAAHELGEQVARVAQELASAAAALGLDAPSTRLLSKLAGQRKAELERLGEQLNDFATIGLKERATALDNLTNLDVQLHGVEYNALPKAMLSVLYPILRFFDRQVVAKTAVGLSWLAHQPATLLIECKGLRLSSQLLANPSQLQFLGEGTSGLNTEWPEVASRARDQGITVEFAADADLGIRIALKLLK